MNAAIEGAAKQVAQANQKFTFDLMGKIASLFTPKQPEGVKNIEQEGAKAEGKKAATPSPNPGGSFPPFLSGGGGNGGKKPSDGFKPADFKTAAKIAAVGAAATAAGLGLNEAAKQLGSTANDAAKTIGETFDNAGKSIGDAFSFVLDPLGLKDPQTKESIGKFVIIGVVVVAAVGMLMLVTRK